VIFHLVLKIIEFACLRYLIIFKGINSTSP
jgi:hypothetical protein